MTNYFYFPLTYFGGSVLKCAGIVDNSNRFWLKREYPNGIELSGYRGDRIKADTHELHTTYVPGESRANAPAELARYM